MSKQTPAEAVIEIFGGISKVAEIIGRDRSTVSRWRNPPPRGHGGLVPGFHHKTLLRSAHRRKLPLTEHILIWGR